MGRAARVNPMAQMKRRGFVAPKPRTSAPARVYSAVALKSAIEQFVGIARTEVVKSK